MATCFSVGSRSLLEVPNLIRTSLRRFRPLPCFAAKGQQLEQQRVHMAGQDVGQVDVHRCGRGWVRGVAQQVRPEVRWEASRNDPRIHKKRLCKAVASVE